MSEDRMLHKDEHRLSEILKPIPSSTLSSHKAMADGPSLSEIVAGAGEPSAPQRGAGKEKSTVETKERPVKHHDRPDKKKVDIADLKKALEQSLAKNFGDEEVVEEPKDRSVI